MNPMRAPDMISHETLFVALEGRETEGNFFAFPSVYEIQLKHLLLSLARKARLEVAAQEFTGLSAAEIHAKSTEELMHLLNECRFRSQLSYGETLPRS